MGLISSVISSILGRIVADEISAYIPRWAASVVNIAVRLMPEDQRSRWREEWSGHISETNGALSKLTASLGFLSAAFWLRNDQLSWFFLFPGLQWRVVLQLVLVSVYLYDIKGDARQTLILRARKNMTLLQLLAIVVLMKLPMKVPSMAGRRSAKTLDWLSRRIIRQAAFDINLGPTLSHEEQIRRIRACGAGVT